MLRNTIEIFKCCFGYLMYYRNPSNGAKLIMRGQVVSEEENLTCHKIVRMIIMNVIQNAV